MMTRAQANALNSRRLTLIMKKRTEGLTDAEAVELADVKERFGAWVEAKYPRDTTALEGFEAKVQELRAKIAASKAHNEVHA